MTKKRVLHVIKTVSIENDGRLQKWIRFLNEEGVKSDIFILEDENKPEVENKYTAKIFKTTLWMRKIFKQRTGYFFKVPEYLFRFFSFIKKRKDTYGVIVFHDLQQYLNIASFILFRKSNTKVVWDLHELPHSVMYKFKFPKLFIKKVLESIDLIVYTNKERRGFIKEKFNHNEGEFFVLNNFPEREYNEKDFQHLPQHVKDWLGGESYILWLGVTNRARNFQTFLKVYSSLFKNRYKLVIIGKIDEEFEKEITCLINDGRIYNDYVKQDDIIKYIDSALFSVVLYNSISPNNYYCEPNRLYQLINRNIPVIVGNNPTLKQIIQDNGFGVVLADDGSSFELMNNAFNELILNLDSYKNKLINSGIKKRCNIDSQLSELSVLISKLN